MTTAQAESTLFDALTLAERVALDRPPAEPADPELARQRLRRWKEQGCRGPGLCAMLV